MIPHQELFINTCSFLVYSGDFCQIPGTHVNYRVRALHTPCINYLPRDFLLDLAFAPCYYFRVEYKEITNMKLFPILLVCAAAATLMPMNAQAQGRRSKRPSTPAAPAAPVTSGTSTEAEAEAPKTGVRFVICSPSGVNMPSPLYVRSGKTFKSISIGSRTPSERVKPQNGVIEFWDKDPGASDDGESKKPASANAKLPDPIFTVKVGNTVGSKAVCILTPDKEVARTNALFLNESDFPRSGMHIINLSSFPLQMVTSESNDFKDKKESKIGVYRREDGISANNSWSFKGKKGQQVSFVLSYADKSVKGYKRIKASTFVISELQSVVNVVVKDQTRNAPKLMTIQLTDNK